MHACMHAWKDVCMCVYGWTDVCMYVWMYRCMHVCMYACAHVCMSVCLYVCMSVFIFTVYVHCNIFQNISLRQQRVSVLKPTLHMVALYLGKTLCRRPKISPMFIGLGYVGDSALDHNTRWKHVSPWPSGHAVTSKLVSIIPSYGVIYT